ncbi:MAG: hypothetical protein ACLQBA_21840 [Candidatus Binataceae bacterium]
MATVLLQAFADVVNAWNAGDYIEVYKYLDPKEFIMKKVDDAGSVVTGVDNLLAYMAGQALQKPQFNPAGGYTEKRWKGETVGQVRGTGTYTDRTLPAPPTLPLNVRFTFTFKRKTDKDHWLLINAFAAEM